MTDFLTRAVSGVQGLHPYVPGKPVEELERELGISDAVKLASNENPLGPSPRALAAIQEGLGDLERYPDGGGFVLRERLAAMLGVTDDMITLGNGSNDVLDLIARTFAGPGHDVIYSEHAFAVYPIATQAVGATAVVTPALDYGTDLDAMAQAITPATRLIFIANPNNPTGTWSDHESLRGFMSRVPDDVIVVIDEAYAEYVDEATYPNTIPWLRDYPNLIVARTFSKIYGLAALRVGYCVSGPVLADLVNRVRHPFNVNTLAQRAAIAALEDTGYVATSRAANLAGLRQLETGLAAMGVEWIPSVGNFVTVDTGRDAAGVYDALLREAVIVRPVANYGLPRHLRVTVGTEQENVRFLDALKAVI